MKEDSSAVSSSVLIIMQGNNEAASPQSGFTCFNVDCYTIFRTERGLWQHLWQSDACCEYMLLPRPPVAKDGVSFTRESTGCRRLGYGVELSRLTNPFMSAVPPSLYKLHEVLTIPQMLLLTMISWTNRLNGMISTVLLPC